MTSQQRELVAKLLGPRPPVRRLSDFLLDWFALVCRLALVLTVLLACQWSWGYPWPI